MNKRKIILITFIALIILWVAGWFITRPYPNYWAFSAGKYSGQVIVIEGYASFSPSLLFEPMWHFYERLHKKRPINIWLYDANRRSLTKKIWPITFDEISPESSSVPPSYCPDSQRLIVTKRYANRKKTRLRILNSNGTVDFEYDINGVVNAVHPSPNENLLVVYYDFHELILINIENKQISALKPVSAMEPFPYSITWYSNDKLLFYARKHAEDEKGLYSYDIQSGVIQKKLSEGRSSFILAEDRKGIIYHNSDSSGKNRNERLYYYELGPNGKHRSFDLGPDFSPIRLFDIKGHLLLVDMIIKSDENEVDFKVDLDKPLGFMEDSLSSITKQMFWGTLPTYGIAIRKYDWNGNQGKAIVLKDKYFDIMGIAPITDSTLIIPFTYKLHATPANSLNPLSIDAYILNLQTGKYQSVGEIVARHHL